MKNKNKLDLTLHYHNGTRPPFYNKGEEPSRILGFGYNYIREDKIPKIDDNKEKIKVGIKNDSEKTRFDLIDWDIVKGIADVLTFGAKKYAPNTWQNIDDAENRYFAAAMRHLIEYRNGESIDKESGLSHLYHAACNLMFLRHFEKKI